MIILIIRRRRYILDTSYPLLFRIWTRRRRKIGKSRATLREHAATPEEEYSLVARRVEQWRIYYEQPMSSSLRLKRLRSALIAPFRESTLSNLSSRVDRADLERSRAKPFRHYRCTISVKFHFLLLLLLPLSSLSSDPIPNHDFTHSSPPTR